MILKFFFSFFGCWRRPFGGRKSARFLSVCFSTTGTKGSKSGCKRQSATTLPPPIGGGRLFSLRSLFFFWRFVVCDACGEVARSPRPQRVFERRFWCAPAIGVVDARVVPRPHRFGRAHSPEIVRGERNARIARGTVARDRREGGGVERGRQRVVSGKIRSKILLLNVVVLLLLLINVKARRRLEERKATRRLCSRTLR